VAFAGRSHRSSVWRWRSLPMPRRRSGQIRVLAPRRRQWADSRSGRLSASRDRNRSSVAAKASSFIGLIRMTRQCCGEMGSRRSLPPAVRFKTMARSVVTSWATLSTAMEAILAHGTRATHSGRLRCHLHISNLEPVSTNARNALDAHDDDPSTTPLSALIACSSSLDE